MPKKDFTKPIQKALGNEAWGTLNKEDPSYGIFAAAPWQSPANYSSNATSIDQSVSIFESSEVDGKPSDMNWRELQEEGYKKYKTFPPLNAAVESKSNYIAGPGFYVYSPVLEISEFLRDLVYSYRNKLYSRVVGWMVRMLSEVEIFVLITLDENGTATIRNLEPGQIGSGDEKGLILDPDDATQTLFYKYSSSKGEEYIPDARWILEPEYMKERLKELKGFDNSKISKSTNKGAKFTKVGGYRRFVMHWKNLTGIPEYQRDTASIATILEWVNYTIQALKWELDYKKALAAHTHDFTFGSDTQGRISWSIWQKMTDAQKKATGLTEPYAPGSKTFIPPGMTHKISAPQLPNMSGNNQDLMLMAGAGMKTPQDMWQGQSSGQTQASIKSTRPPLMFETESLQHAFGNWFTYEFLRVCMHAKIMLGGKVITATGKDYTLNESYKDRTAYEDANGKPEIVDIDVEPIWKIELGFPVVELDIDPDKTVNSSLGSKHAGWAGMGVSRKTLARKGGIPLFNKEIAESLVEKEKYGDIVSGSEVEKSTENKFKKEGTV